LDGIDGLAVGDSVTAEQMRALFGCGLHPSAGLRQQQLERPDLSQRDLQEGPSWARRSRSSMVSSARSGSEVAPTHRGDQIGSWPAGERAADGRSSRAGADRGGGEFFSRDTGREPMDARELGVKS
jgi:hypothetical protein